jgi:hypothetical protein
MAAATSSSLFNGSFVALGNSTFFLGNTTVWDAKQRIYIYMYMYMYMYMIVYVYIYVCVCPMQIYIYTHR